MHENIHAMLVSQEFFERGTNMETPLCCFDDLVRHKLPPHIQASGVRWHHCFAVGLTFLGEGLDVLASDIAGGTAQRITVVRFWNYLAQAVFLAPVLALSASWFSTRCLHLSVRVNFLCII